MTQPTHDEVIAWIDREVIEAGWSADSPVDSYLLHHQSDIDEANRYRASLLANRAGLERHKERPFNWMTDKAIGMFSKAFPEPPQLPRCVTCRHIDFPCPTYTDISNPIRSVM